LEKIAFIHECLKSLILPSPQDCAVIACFSSDWDAVLYNGNIHPPSTANNAINPPQPTSSFPACDRRNDDHNTDQRSWDTKFNHGGLLRDCSSIFSILPTLTPFMKGLMKEAIKMKKPKCHANRSPPPVGTSNPNQNVIAESPQAPRSPLSADRVATEENSLFVQNETSASIVEKSAKFLSSLELTQYQQVHTYMHVRMHICMCSTDPVRVFKEQF
jgi:hypothetical protein